MKPYVIDRIASVGSTLADFRYSDDLEVLQVTERLQPQPFLRIASSAVGAVTRSGVTAPFANPTSGESAPTYAYALKTQGQKDHVA